MQILIADDHDLVRDGLKPILMKLGPEVSILECANFPDALELANRNDDIDLVVLDLRMPGMDGANGIAVFHMARVSHQTVGHIKTSRCKVQ